MHVFDKQELLKKLSFHFINAICSDSLFISEYTHLKSNIKKVIKKTTVYKVFVKLETLRKEYHDDDIEQIFKVEHSDKEQKIVSLLIHDLDDPQLDEKLGMVS